MNWSDAINTALPVIALVVGYLGTLSTESRRDARALEASKVGRAAEQAASRAQERRAFELETLIATMDALRTMARAVGKVHHFDLEKAREKGVDEMPTTLIPSDLDEEEFAAHREVRRLGSLLLDEDVRNKVEAAANATAAVATTGPRPVAQAEAELNAFAGLLDEAQAALGERVRGIYDGTVTIS